MGIRKSYSKPTGMTKLLCCQEQEGETLFETAPLYVFRDVSSSHSASFDWLGMPGEAAQSHHLPNGLCEIGPNRLTEFTLVRNLYTVWKRMACGSLKYEIKLDCSLCRVFMARVQEHTEERPASSGMH